MYLWALILLRYDDDLSGSVSISGGRGSANHKSPVKNLKLALVAESPRLLALKGMCPKRVTDKKSLRGRLKEASQMRGGTSSRKSRRFSLRAP